MIMALRIFLNQVRMGLKLYLRIPAAIFWVFAFPVIMFMGLGAVMSGGDTGIKLVWAGPQTPEGADLFLQQALAEERLTVETLNRGAAETRWQGGKLPAMLEGEQGHYSLRLNSYLAAQGSHIEALVQQAFLIAQARAAGAPELAHIPVQMSSPGGHHEGPYTAYLLPGLMGLNLLMMGIFSTGMVDVTLRAKGGYKRLATTPLPCSVYLAAQLCVRLIVVCLSAALLMSVGALFFGVYNQGSYGSILVLLLLGAACFISMGYLLASFSRNVESYNGIANLVFLPTMLLSGVYFSLDAAPVWLQRGADVTPLASLLRALRAVFNDGASLASQGTGLAILVGWTIVLFTLASRRFRWV
jgi:ABC-type multidrug transport system permease subunit